MGIVCKNYVWMLSLLQIEGNLIAYLVHKGEVIPIFKKKEKKKKKKKKKKKIQIWKTSFVPGRRLKSNRRMADGIQHCILSQLNSQNRMERECLHTRTAKESGANWLFEGSPLTLSVTNS